MAERYRFSAALACAVLAGIAIIVAAQRIDLGPASKLIRPPDNAIGTRCARGDVDACKVLCFHLSDVSTIKCVDHLAAAFPKVHDGSAVAGGTGSSSGSGGGASGGAPQPSTGVGGSPSILPAPSGGSGGGGGGSGNGPPGPSGPPGPPGSPGPTGPPGGNGGGTGGGSGTTTTSVCVQNPLLPACVRLHTPPLPRLP